MFHTDFLAFPSLEAYVFFWRKSDLNDGTMEAKDVFEYRKCSLVLGSQEQRRSQSSDIAMVTEMLWKCRNLVSLVCLSHNITYLSSFLSLYSSAHKPTIFVFPLNKNCNSGT